MIIYLILNRVNGKVYIGKHRGCDPQHRWKRHLYDAKRGSIYPFHSAIRKYGSSAFIVTVLSGYASSEDDLNQQEVFFISKYRAREPTYGYNLGKGGEGPEPTHNLRTLRAAFMRGNKNVLGKRWKSPANSRRIASSRWITNGTTNKYVLKSAVQSHLDRGWKLGRINTKWVRNATTHLWINKDGKRARVKPEDLQSRLTAGWQRGKGVMR